MTRGWRFLLVVIAALAALGGVARAEERIASLDPPVEIRGPWAVHGGDAAAFAQPGFDDSSWRRVGLSDVLEESVSRERVVWFRKRLSLAPAVAADVARHGASSSLGVACSNYEVYADGIRVGGAGRMDDEAQVRLQRPVTMQLPPQVASDGEILIAVRTSLPATQRLYRQRFQPSAVLLGINSAVELETQLRLQRERPRLYLILASCVAWLVCIAFFSRLWWRRRERRADLWFALTACCFLVSSSAAGLSDYAETAVLPWGWAGLPAVFSVGLAGLLQMGWFFLRRSEPPRYWRALQIALLVGSAAALARGWLGHDLVGAYRIVAVLAAMAAITVVTVVEVFRGNRDARPVAVGWVVAAVVATYEPIADTVRWPAFPSTNVAALIVILSTAYALLVQFIRSMDELDLTNRAIRRFVPFEFLDLLNKPSVRDIQVGDQVELELTVLFSDIRSFTALSEGLTPEETIQLVNRFLAQVEPCIHEHGGFINTYTGDGLMALFHADVDEALRGGIEMFRALERWNASRRQGGEPEVRVGVGMHTGKVMLGTLGSGDRLDTNVIGDSANLAARVEGMTKLYGAPLLITEATASRLAHREAVSLREVDRVVAKGKQEPVVIFEVLEAEPRPLKDHKLGTAARFSAGLAAYRSGDFSVALQPFRELAAECPEDAAAALYVERCERFALDPPAAWDGITRLDSKG